MLFWHLGMTCAIVFFALGARRIDYRVVLLGAIVPDLIDKPLGRIFFPEYFQTGRLFGHTLLMATFLLLGIQLTLRGATARRWFILPICMLIHQVLDGMWNDPITWFWPLFGTEFPPDPAPGHWLGLLTSPWQLAGEVVGLAVLVYLGRAYQLQDPALRSRFLRRGELIDRPERMNRSDRIGGPPQPPGVDGESPTTANEGD